MEDKGKFVPPADAEVVQSKGFVPPSDAEVIEVYSPKSNAPSETGGGIGAKKTPPKSSTSTSASDVTKLGSFGQAISPVAKPKPEESTLPLFSSQQRLKEDEAKRVAAAKAAQVQPKGNLPQVNIPVLKTVGQEEPAVIPKSYAPTTQQNIAKIEGMTLKTKFPEYAKSTEVFDFKKASAQAISEEEKTRQEERVQRVEQRRIDNLPKEIDKLKAEKSDLMLDQSLEGRKKLAANEAVTKNMEKELEDANKSKYKTLEKLNQKAVKGLDKELFDYLSEYPKLSHKIHTVGLTESETLSVLQNAVAKATAPLQQDLETFQKEGTVALAANKINTSNLLQAKQSELQGLGDQLKKFQDDYLKKNGFASLTEQFNQAKQKLDSYAPVIQKVNSESIVYQKELESIKEKIDGYASKIQGDKFNGTEAEFNEYKLLISDYNETLADLNNLTSVTYKDELAGYENATNTYNSILAKRNSIVENLQNTEYGKIKSNYEAAIIQYDGILEQYKKYEEPAVKDRINQYFFTVSKLGDYDNKLKAAKGAMPSIEQFEKAKAEFNKTGLAGDALDIGGRAVNSILDASKKLVASPLRLAASFSDFFGNDDVYHYSDYFADLIEGTGYEPMFMTKESNNFYDAKNDKINWGYNRGFIPVIGAAADQLGILLMFAYTGKYAAPALEGYMTTAGMDLTAAAEISESAKIASTIAPAFLISYGDNYREAIEKGFSTGGAIAYSSGLSFLESATELMIPDKELVFGKDAKSILLNRFIKDYAKGKKYATKKLVEGFLYNAFGEATEEELSAIGKTIFTSIGHLMDKDIAIDIPTINQTITTSITSGITGGGMGIIGQVSENSNMYQLGVSKLASDFKNGQDLLKALKDKGKIDEKRYDKLITDAQKYQSVRNKIPQGLSEYKTIAIAGKMIAINDLASQMDKDKNNPINKINQKKINAIQDEIEGIIDDKDFDKNYNEELNREADEMNQKATTQPQVDLQKFTAATPEKYGYIDRGDGKGKIELTQEEFEAEQAKMQAQPTETETTTQPTETKAETTEEKAATTQPTETKTQEIQPTPIEEPKVSITGTRRGFETLSSTDNTKGQENKDARSLKFDENGVSVQTDKDGNRTVFIKTEARDDVGRIGNMTIQIQLPKGVDINTGAIRKIIDGQVEQLRAKNNYSFDLQKVSQQEFNSIRDAVVNELKNPTKTETKAEEQAKTAETKAETTEQKAATETELEQKKAEIERRRQEALNNVGIKQKQANFEKLRNAKTPEEKLNAINLIERNVAEGSVLTKEEQKEVQKVKDELSSQGYKVPKILGQKYHQGMKVLVTSSIPDETLAEGEEVITKVINPQINKDDKMVQTAQIEVTVGTKKGGLTREQWLEEKKKKEKRTDKINAKYDAELAALETEQKQQKNEKPTKKENGEPMSEGVQGVRTETEERKTSAELRTEEEKVEATAKALEGVENKIISKLIDFISVPIKALRRDKGERQKKDLTWYAIDEGYLPTLEKPIKPVFEVVKDTDNEFVYTENGVKYEVDNRNTFEKIKQEAFKNYEDRISIQDNYYALSPNNVFDIKNKEHFDKLKSYLINKIGKNKASSFLEDAFGTSDFNENLTDDVFESGMGIEMVTETNNPYKDIGFDAIKFKEGGKSIVAIFDHNKVKFGRDVISEAYHKAKADGSNPELVKAVEELLGKPEEKVSGGLTPQEKSNLESIAEKAGVNFQEVRNIYNKYGEGKPLTEITLEDYQKAEEKRQGKKEEKQVTKETVWSKIKAYNNLNKTERKSAYGSKLRSEIMSEAASLNYTISPTKQGKFILIDEKGKQVKAIGTPRSKDKIQEEKRLKERRNRARREMPISVKHSVAQDIANGMQFDRDELKRVTGWKDADIPFWLTTKKGGVSLEFYAQRLQEKGFAQEEEGMDFVSEVADAIGEFANRKGKTAALEFIEKQQEIIENGGFTDAELQEQMDYYQAKLDEENFDYFAEYLSQLTPEEAQSLADELREAEKLQDQALINEILDKNEEQNKPTTGQEQQEADTETLDIEREAEKRETEIKQVEQKIKELESSVAKKQKQADKLSEESQGDIFGGTKVQMFDTAEELKNLTKEIREQKAEIERQKERLSELKEKQIQPSNQLKLTTDAVQKPSPEGQVSSTGKGGENIPESSEGVGQSKQGKETPSKGVQKEIDDIFNAYDQIESSKGMDKRKAAEVFRNMTENIKNPTLKRIFDNIKSIHSQLEKQGLITKTKGCP